MTDTGRPASVERYLRGVAWSAGNGVTYPRADPTDAGRLPIDTWATASLPVGVRLEFVGDATDVDVSYRTATDQLGYRGPGVGTTFTVWRSGLLVDEQPAVFGTGLVRLHIRNGAPDDARAIVYLPEGMQPTLTDLTAISGAIAPATRQSRWLAYGDSIAEGWIASGPARAWPAIAGRTLGLDVINHGYAGSARGELVSAQQIASLDDLDVISISHGTNCWTRIPHSAAQMEANTDAFLRVVRSGHPFVPIVVTSPIVRPDGESTPNVLGATHAEIRVAMETATRRLIEAGDDLITLVSGADVVDPTLLADGVHPGDDGHAVLARVFGGAVAATVRPPRG